MSFVTVVKHGILCEDEEESLLSVCLYVWVGREEVCVCVCIWCENMCLG